MLLNWSAPVLLLFLFVVTVTPVQCSWWFLSRLQVASVGVSGTAMCNLVPGLSRRQRKLCQLHPAAMEAVSEGVKMAVSECQRQFTGDRWNCSAVESAGLGRCKCHGVSGSCTTKTCWKAVPPFEDVGRLLKAKYEHAMQVTVSQQGAALLPSAIDVRLDEPIANRTRSSRMQKNPKERVKRSELVFFEPSPDYCVRDPETGSLGTAGRRCNKTSTGADSCDLLCCGRGYDTKRVVVNEQCECKFVWCCEVKCHTCRRVVDIHTCKGAAPIPRSEFFRGPNNNSDHAASKPLDNPGRFRYSRREYTNSVA
uniref:Protein Wnt n=1 Tax=Plectus sambesii TaxID=2011161 RepID=A0A914WVR4_9BILA